MTAGEKVTIPRSANKPDVRPVSFAHVVFKTARYEQMVDFYCLFLNAHVVMGNSFVSFLTYDDEHHRVAIAKMDGLEEHNPKAAGLEHVSYTYASLGDILANYSRLKEAGILPYWCINHGPTTSLYYRDPDGNQLETQADNFPTLQELVGFFETDTFKANPLGVEFDPDRLLECYLAGYSEEELKQQGSAPIRPGAGYLHPVGEHS